MWATEGSGSPSMPTSHSIGSGVEGCGPGGKPRSVSRSNSSQSRGTLNAVRSDVLRTYSYRGAEHAVASTMRAIEASAHLVRRPRTVAVIAPLCGVFRERWTPRGGIPSGRCLPMSAYVASGRPSNGIESAIVVRVATPAFSRRRRIRSSRSPVVFVRTLRM